MLSKFEEFEKRVRLTEEECSEINARIADPDCEYREVDWLEPGDDPFGMDWKWTDPEGLNQESGAIKSKIKSGFEVNPDGNDGKAVTGEDPTNVTTKRISPSSRSIGLWKMGLAASILLAVFATWAIYAGSGQGLLREHPITAWVTERLDPGKDGLRITAPAEDVKDSEIPLINHLDRPVDVQRPSTPNLYAPVRVQKQLIIPDLPSAGTSGKISDRPMRSLVETARPGSLFYLEASTAATPSVGSAVVVRARNGTWRLLWDEITVSPADGTCYFGPIKMEGEGADYFVIMADRSGSPLLRAVNTALPPDGTSPTEVDSWKARMAIALNVMAEIGSVSNVFKSVLRPAKSPRIKWSAWGLSR